MPLPLISPLRVDFDQLVASGPAGVLIPALQEVESAVIVALPRVKDNNLRAVFWAELAAWVQRNEQNVAALLIGSDS